jgi:hypothetical protein
MRLDSRSSEGLPGGIREREEQRWKMEAGRWKQRKQLQREEEEEHRDGRWKMEDGSKTQATMWNKRGKREEQGEDRRGKREARHKPQCGTRETR